MLAQNAHAVFQRRALSFFCTVRGQAAGEGTFRIVGAADKCPVTAQFEAETPRAAGGAVARVRPVLTRREEERPEVFVQRVQNIGNRQVFGIGNCFGERIPEVGQNVFPLSPAIGNIIQQFFKAGGERGVHILLKE